MNSNLPPGVTEARKYTVAWVEIHQDTVDAINEEDAMALATKNRTEETYYTVVDAFTRVEMHNPANKILQGLTVGLLKELRRGN